MVVKDSQKYFQSNSLDISLDISILFSLYIFLLCVTILSPPSVTILSCDNFVTPLFPFHLHLQSSVYLFNIYTLPLGCCSLINKFLSTKELIDLITALLLKFVCFTICEMLIVSLFLLKPQVNLITTRIILNSELFNCIFAKCSKV